MNILYEMKDSSFSQPWFEIKDCLHALTLTVKLEKKKVALWLVIDRWSRMTFLMQLAQPTSPLASFFGRGRGANCGFSSWNTTTDRTASAGTTSNTFRHNFEQRWILEGKPVLLGDCVAEKDDDKEVTPLMIRCVRSCCVQSFKSIGTCH